MAEKTISDTTNVVIFAALLLLTFSTYYAALFDLGRWNTPIGLMISGCKAVLIILYFMHARYSKWLTWVTIVAGLFWFGILLVLTMGDYLTRAWGVNR